MAFYDRIKFTISNTPGTGSGFTVNAASSGFRTPATASIPNSTAAVLLITEGTAWEICNSVYTSGSTAWSRGSLVASSTGSAVNFTSAAVVGIIVAAHQLVDKTGDTMTGLLTTLASASGTAGFNLPHGAAPSSPVDGDLWTTSAGGLYTRINGVTVGPFAVPSITTGTPSVLSNTAVANFTIDATKRQNIFVLQQIVPATDDVELQLLASIDGGSNYNVSITSQIIGGGATVVDEQQAGSTTGVNLSPSTAIGSTTTESGASIVLHFEQLSGKFAHVYGHGFVITSNATPFNSLFSAVINTATAVTNLQFKQSSGNMESGTITPLFLN